MKSLLGIDIDGVFNIVSYDAVPNDINRTPVRYLNKILEAIPECDVLITSSWCNYDNKTIEALVSAGFKYPERVIGNTENLSGECSRTKEIKKWLCRLAKRVRVEDVLIEIEGCEEKILIKNDNNAFRNMYEKPSWHDDKSENWCERLF